MDMQHIVVIYYISTVLIANLLLPLLVMIVAYSCIANKLWGRLKHTDVSHTASFKGKSL